LPSINIVWHDHNGLSEFISKKKSFILKVVSYFFIGIVEVNHQLKKWALSELNCKNVIYLANFTNLDSDEVEQTKLLGEEGKKILCLANLRFQKNHFFLIEIAKKLKKSHPDWTFHLVGKDFSDNYSAKITQQIKLDNLQNHVILYGSREDTHHVIRQADICILTSLSEGLPVALLEYGLNKKPIVSTDVGEIPLIIKNGLNGFIAPHTDEEMFYNYLVKVIDDKELRDSLGANLLKTIKENNSEVAVVNRFLNWLN
jgi:glycosyltransferase involved in cell wall biosynthesis